MLSHFSHVQLFVTLLTVALQAPLSMGFSRQEYWSELTCTSPGSLPNPETEPRGQTHVSWVSCIGKQIFTTAPLGKPLGQSINTIFKRLLFLVFLIDWTLMSFSHAHIGSEPFLGSSHRYFLMSLSYFLQVFQSFTVLIRLINWYLIYKKQRMSPIYIMHPFGTPDI